MEVLGEQGGPGLAEHGSGDLDLAGLGVADQQLLEEELVAQASDLGAAEAVDLVAAADQFERAVQGLLDASVHHLGGDQDLLGLLQLGLDAPLLLAGDVFGNGAGDDGPAEPAALLLQLGNPGAGMGHLGGGPVLLVVEFGAQALADLLLHGLGQPDGAVKALDRGLDGFGGEVALGADGAALVAAEAEEVQVGALGVGQAQPAAAVPAVDGALEVVVVAAALLAGGVVHAQHLLDAVEQMCGDEWLVAALVLLAVERHEAEVVAVAQHVGDARELDRTGQFLAVRQRLQASGCQSFGEGAEGVLAGGVGLVGPLHERCPLRVDHDDADLAAILTAPAGVQVPDGCPARRAADLGLLGHALEGFGAEVLGVELGDPRHDGVQQLPGWGLVDVLLDRDELRAGHPQLEQRVGVITAVAGEPVHLVENDVVDVPVVLDEPEHLLELGSVGSLGALAPVDERRHHLSVERLGFAFAGVLLGGQ